MVRCDRAHDDGVNFGRRHAALGESAFGGFDRHIGRRHFGVRYVPLADAGALHDPSIVGLDQFFQVLIREHARRHVAPERRDLRLEQCRWVP